MECTHDPRKKSDVGQDENSPAAGRPNVGVDGELKPRQMHPIPEDEGLVKETQRDPRRAADVDGLKLSEAAQAAQRGRTV